MNKRRSMIWLAVVAVLACAGALAYLLRPPGTNIINSEQEARTSCEIALESHLRDVKKEDEKWQIATVRFDSSADRWLCTLTDNQGKKLFIILKPKTGGFEVSASNN